MKKCARSLFQRKREEKRENKIFYYVLVSHVNKYEIEHITHVARDSEQWLGDRPKAEQRGREEGHGDMATLNKQREVWRALGICRMQSRRHRR